ncbi:hypothetical protein [Pseudonocardia sp. KRD291]|uniref:hypothetical protein n=1 Tax=Pseudonocardia sp. KRD291 TaxID=2792007 RepID=UPI001C49DF13|nr:hypothetical protein [Pseudonocardia sp. KRD291]MBW0102400.1 hypothetical protein [Pseudonocardia sp. KRD291]
MPPGTDPPAPRPRVAVLAIRREATAREEDRSLEEMIFEVAHDTLADAGLSQATVGGVVLSGNDQSDGRVISCMTSAGPAGGVDSDVTMIASSGEHALAYGWLRLRSGQGDTVLVIGWGKPSEGVNPDYAELVSAEPYVLRAVGMNDTIAAALQASRWTDPATAGDTATVSWPLTADDLPRRGDVVVAAVLAVEGTFSPGRELAWVRGAGWSTENYELGARDVGAQTALDQALAHLARGADSAPAPSTWDSVEIAAPSEPAAARAAGKLGLPTHATVNGSGSLHERLAPAHIAGLDRLLAAAGSVGPGTGTAAGVGFNGFAGQGATVMVFGAPGTKEGVA